MRGRHFKNTTLDWLDKFEFNEDNYDAYLTVPFLSLKVLDIHEKISTNSRRDKDDAYLEKGADLDLFITAYLGYFELPDDQIHKELFWRECVRIEDHDFMDEPGIDDYYF